MKRPQKVHCLFEQSGTFKREFIKLGIPAEDYDIQNNFGETDHVIDLFHEIEEAYRGGASVFDGIAKDDLIIAFFPCIYFTGSTNPCYYTLENINYRSLSLREKFDKILKRSADRQAFFVLLNKLAYNCISRNLRLVVENPWGGMHYLEHNFLKPPSVVDSDRTRRGDVFSKPTAYWFFNCEPTHGRTFQKTPADKVRIVWESKSSSRAGLCSEERSMISPDYARNFICDFILGEPSGKVPQQVDMFDMIGKGGVK